MIKLRLLTLLATATLSLSAVSGLSAATTIIRGPYLQSASPTSMVVRWRTDNTDVSIVRYGLSRTELTSTAKAEGISSEHIVFLSKLKPNTRYYYTFGPEPVAKATTATATTKAEPTKAAATATETVAEDAPGKTPTYSFVTPPEPGPAQPTRVWVLGDPGTKNDVQRAVRDQYLKFAGKRSADMVLLLGDNAYPEGTDTDYQKAIFEMYPETLRTTPLWSVLGNHDAKSSNSITQSGVYYDLFTLPTRAQSGGVASGTEAYYSFDHANIHFIALDSSDSDRAVTGAMMEWLKADLAATKRDWIIAFFHHPPYTKGTHDSDSDKDSTGRMNEMRQNFLPIMEAGGVDLVLTGHSHVYERSFLLDGHYGKSTTFDAATMIKQKGEVEADGVVVYRKPRARTPHAGDINVVTGSAGHASAKPVKLNHPAFYVSLNEPGSSVVDIDGLRLDLTFINDKGELRDRFSIIKE
ncbi:MAG: metallophosphoesterase family protein [Verrucomicrobia bacterium]|nr:metallophosphoesterase family protein [Verrucomicrobiota bacterium]